jgi:hypothetical protein
MDGAILRAARRAGTPRRPRKVRAPPRELRTDGPRQAIVNKGYTHLQFTT